MKSNTSLTTYLTQNNSWVLLVTITFIVFKWVLNVMPDSTMTPVVYLHYAKWITFFKTVGALILIFSPIVLYAHFYSFLQQRFSKSVFWTMSAFLLIGYPVLVSYTNMSFLIPSEVTMMPEVVGMNGLVLSVLAVFTQPGNWLVSKLSFYSLSKILTPTRIILGLLLVLSIQGTLRIKMVNGEEMGFLLLWVQNVFLLAFYYLFFKINHEYLIQIIFKEKGVVYYFFAFLGLMMLFYIPMMLIYYFLPGFRTFLNYNLADTWIGDGQRAYWAIYSGTITGFMIMTIPLAILVEWFTQANSIIKLKGEKSQTELSLLKQQINPHFFFNTLNNVYAMSLTNDKSTSQGILQLSDLMRYVIYKGQEETVSLNDEVKYLEDYLDLQKLRLHKNLDLRFEKEIEVGETAITPLLFIILVENAFKHGIEGAEGEGYLHLALKQAGRKVSFSCYNSVETGGPEKTPGLGLKNLRRRLELLYPDRHNLSIEEYPDSYRVDLTIQL